MTEKILRCGDCRACCQMKDLVVTLEHGDEELLSFYNVDEYKKAGKWVISKSRSGACIYLQPHGCSIYDQRPHACKVFDCRKFAERDFSFVPANSPTWPQLEEIFAAARDMNRRAKQSCAHRFNAALKG